MDLSSYSRQDLLKLRKQVEQELNARRRVDQRTARQEIREIAEKYGVSLSDLVTGMKASDARPTQGQVLYRNPNDPSQGWSGRGRKPNWLKEWEAGGGTLDQLRSQ